MLERHGLKWSILNKTILFKVKSHKSQFNHKMASNQKRNSSHKRPGWKKGEEEEKRAIRIFFIPHKVGYSGPLVCELDLVVCVCVDYERDEEQLYMWLISLLKSDRKSSDSHRELERSVAAGENDYSPTWSSLSQSFPNWETRQKEQPGTNKKSTVNHPPWNRPISDYVSFC